MSLASGHELGPYEILEPVGKGGMGEVYRALDRKLGRQVAIKTLPAELACNPATRIRFQREARLLAALNHPNIAAIYGFEESGADSFLVLELVEGETLAGRLKRAGPLPLADVLSFAGQMAESLEAAHAKGITHRDIKPANIKITPEGRVKVLDFGLAKAIQRSRDTPDLTQGLTLTMGTEAGTILGTPAYMSPEQARGHEVDHRTDIWAFGCVLYEMFSGQRPFRGETLADVLGAVMGKEPDWGSLPVETPERVHELLRQCLKKDASERLQTMAAASSAIGLVQAGSPGVSRRRIMSIAGGSVAAALGLPLAFDLGGVRSRFFGGDPSIRSIAVLPLANLSGDPGQEYFSDGMTESLIADLAKIGALKVISRTSIMTYKGANKPLPEIARELGVDAVLEGSAVRAGSRMRVSLQLIDARTDRHLWAETFDREFADALLLQSEVARTVARQLQAQLTPQEQTRLTSARRVDPEAYEAYLKGVFAGGSTREDFNQAEQYFMLALEKQSDYAPAYAGIARVWGGRQQYGFVSPQESRPRIVEATEKALALDDSLAEVHYTLGRMKVWTLWDFPGGEASFRRAIELDPNYPDPRVFYARLLNFLLRPTEALSQIERALELDPHNTFFRGMYAIDLCFTSRYDDAIAQARQALMEDPDEQQAEGALRIAYIGKGMIKEAMESHITAITKRRRDPELAQVQQRLYDQGRYTEAAKAGAELLEERVRKGQFVAAGQISSQYGLAGLPEKALEWVEKSVEQRDPNVLGCRHLSRKFPELESNPRFQTVLRRIGLPLASG